MSSNIGAADNDGFVNGSSVISEMASQGFVEDQAGKALQRLAKKRLIETPHAHYREIPVPDEVGAAQFHFRATSIGIYHIRYWSGSFAFLDAVATDTPILDEQSRVCVSRLASSFEIADRLARTQVFRDYLEAQWHAGNFGANYYDFPDLLRSQAGTFTAVDAVVSRPNSARH